MKVDFTISRKPHINIGDYSNIEPQVYLTVRDVDVKNLKEVKQAIGEVLDCWIADEALDLLQEFSGTVKISPKIQEYKEILEESEKERKKSLHQALSKLESIEGDSNEI